MTPDQAQAPAFQDAVAQAVADQLDVDPSAVTITSTTVGDNGAVVVMYVVQGVDAGDVGDAQDSLQNRDMAAAIGENLHEAGFDEAEVGPADTGIANVQVMDYYDDNHNSTPPPHTSTHPPTITPINTPSCVTNTPSTHSRY